VIVRTVARARVITARVARLASLVDRTRVVITRGVGRIAILATLEQPRKDTHRSLDPCALR
jgi:hypothetical protein